jgi:hypothetical protein
MRQPGAEDFCGFCIVTHFSGHYVASQCYADLWLGNI